MGTYQKFQLCFRKFASKNLSLFNGKQSERPKEFDNKTLK